MYINKNDLNFRYNKIEKLISHICNNEYKYFLNKSNVIGVGLGYKFINNINTFEPCLHVLVTKKLSKNLLNNNDLIPPIYKNTKTDVIETGIISVGNSLNQNSPSFLTKKIRPIQPGCGLGTLGNVYFSKNNNTGTLGYIVLDNRQQSKSYCLLSTNSTFAGLNKSLIGAKIIQPSLEHGGSEKDTVAKLLRYVPIQFNKPSSQPINYVDCAVASYVLDVGQMQLINPHIADGIGIPIGITTPKIDELLQWTGCVTGYHAHKITTVNATLNIFYQEELTKAMFKDIFVINGNINGDYNDRGSLMLTKNNMAVGMLFGGAKETVVGCRIDRVIKELDVKLLTL